MLLNLTYGLGQFRALRLHWVYCQFFLTVGTVLKIEDRAVGIDLAAKVGLREGTWKSKAESDHAGVLWRVPSRRGFKLSKLRSELKCQLGPTDELADMSIKQVAGDILDEAI